MTFEGDGNLCWIERLEKWLEDDYKFSSSCSRLERLGEGVQVCLKILICIGFRIGVDSSLMAGWKPLYGSRFLCAPFAQHCHIGHG